MLNMDHQMDAEERLPVKVFCRNCHAKLDLSMLEPFSYVECPECGTRLRVPERFDRYLLEKVCGIGGMSRVYRAIEPDLARRVAVKILNPNPAGIDAARFLEEARMVARINHPGVIPIYNCGVFRGRTFLVMRYMEHGSLEQHLKAGTLPRDGALICGWILTIAEGLEFALTQEKIVHHDVKPGNILLTAENDAKLGDFDLADVRDSGDMLTLCDGGWGSPGYVSPERLLYGGEDHMGDIFSLGVTLYELLTGELPFGIQGEPEELLERRSSGMYRKLADVRSDLPGQLSELIGKMLSYLPESRPEYPEICNCLRECIEVLAVDESPTLARKIAGWLHRNAGE